ncbi:hypothetical protein BPGQ101_19755 [Bacillus altitudinis]|uniref:zinc ribbon domain-containing protein n=1 Tax=Bacillus altitudinis TaxID=293387 RepID=UPI0010FFA323|nr:zinc ribbon domain-containing protein [Bacillus altitudinis]QCU21015.1 hypothetical protein BPGQ101_19755 [Bacillus altitudinis]
MKIRSYMPQKIHFGSYFLAGLLRCPSCDGSMVHHKTAGGKYKYYTCLNNKNGKLCSSNLIPKESTEEFVLTEISSIISSPAIQQIIRNRLYSQHENEINVVRHTISKAKRSLSILDKNIEKTYKAYYESDEQFHIKQIQRLNKQKVIYENKIKDANKLLNKFRKIDLDEILANLTYNFTSYFISLNNDEKKSFLQTIIKEITILPGDKPKKRKIEKIEFHVNIDDLPLLLAG